MEDYCCRHVADRASPFGHCTWWRRNSLVHVFFSLAAFICLPTHTHAHTRKHTHKLAMFQHANSSINDIICVTNKNEIERKKVDCSKAENNKSTRYEENKNQI
uniref:(northern house mosquito) hypothetical protein n=1 Tax=Culex pipiens TaxID=7175 RepID=A0A8D8AJK4_CULPI